MKQLLILILLFTAACTNSVTEEENVETKDTLIDEPTDTIALMDTPEIVVDSQKILINEFFTDIFKEKKLLKCMVVRCPDDNLLAQLEMINRQDVENPDIPLFYKESGWLVWEVMQAREELKSSNIKEWDRGYFPTSIRFDTTSFSNCLIEEKRECEVSMKQFQWAYFKDEMSVEYYTFSEPVFTSDGKWALVSYENRCFGECGHGELVICKKQNGHWVIVDELNMWIG